MHNPLYHGAWFWLFMSMVAIAFVWSLVYCLRQYLKACQEEKDYKRMCDEYDRRMAERRIRRQVR